MRVPCNANPLRGICTKFKTLDEQISSLQAEGAVDLSGYAEVDHGHDPPDLSGYATDAELSSGLAGKADLSHTHSTSGKTLLEGHFLKGGSSTYMDYTGTTFANIPYYQVQLVVSVGDVIHADFAVGVYCITGVPSIEGRFYSDMFGVTVRRAYASSALQMVWPWSDTITVNILSNGTLTMGYQFRCTWTAQGFRISDTRDRDPVMSVLQFR